MITQLITRCTICRSEFSDEEIQNIEACPKCNTTSIPCDMKDDVTIQINWHELRILGIWAENWARQLVADGTKDSDKVVAAIAKAIEQQYPDKTPITLSGELRDIRKTFPDMETNVDLKPHLVGIKGDKEC